MEMDLTYPSDQTNGIMLYALAASGQIQGLFNGALGLR